MGQKLKLTASDGHDFGAYRAAPTGAAKGSVVVIQEIFGVNHHIRAVSDRVAELGYTAIAPQLFDRFEPDFESGYSPDEIAHCRGFLANIDWDAFLRDVEAARAVVAVPGRTAIVGFCMGGSVAFLGACRIDGFDAAVAYYGGRIVDFSDEVPRCPTQMHFGELDESIPMTAVETIKAKRGDCDIHVYPGAAHGFHCDERGSFHPEAAKAAWERTTAWLAGHMA
jgi:carboxymethylenebutenolidase